jgi:hypothetical protein
MEVVMKSLVYKLVFVSSFVVSTVAFAQTSDPGNLTQAQAVPSGGAAQTSSYGGASAGSGDAGSSAQTGSGHGLFGFLHGKAGSGHHGDECVGPVSYCTPFFGS